MKYITILAIALTVAGGKAQNVPAIGTDSTIEVANWNLQWFGNTSYGPSNENTQMSNIALTINKSKMDVWGLCEVSDTNAWDSLLTRIPDYTGVISTWNQEQKTALLFRSSRFRFLYKKHPLSSFGYDFAGGRLPLEVGLEADMGAWKDTLVFFVIHLKSNVGTDLEKAESLDRRNSSAIALKSYIEGLGNNKKCMVIGDWNDDLDKSVFLDKTTPFKFWLNDSTNYKFPTLALTLAGEKSMEAYTEVIDHQCIYGRLVKDFVPNSAKVFYLKNYITGYANNTSDHYPVYSILKLKQSPFLGVSAAAMPAFRIVYFNDGFNVVSNANISQICWFDLAGKQYPTVQKPGVYVLKFSSNGQAFTTKLYLQLP